MELNINIQETIKGDLIVTELAYEEGAYASDTASQFTDDTVLFSESASVTTVAKGGEDEIMQAVIHDHSNTNVVNTMSIPADGWYTVTQLVIPDLDWLDEAITVGYLSKFDRVFVTDKAVLYEYKNSSLTETDISEAVYCTGTTNIWTTVKDCFVIHDLWECYFNWCRKMLESECSKDSACPDCDSDLYRYLSLVWVFLNAIMYAVQLGDFDKATELLETVTGGCNSLCANEMFTRTYDCGCV